LMRR